jgi:inosine/xanthosine triphosphate pyrophosphatase family protein
LWRTRWPRPATPRAHSGLPALADDAGLCVEAFGGLPGVQTPPTTRPSSRYAKGDDNNVRPRWPEMHDIDNRRAAPGQHPGGGALTRRPGAC